MKPIGKCFPKCFLVLWGVLITLSLTASAEAASQSGLKVKILATGNDGVYVGFTVQPTDCAGNYKKTHGFISRNLKNFDKYFGLLALKRVENQSVKITYEDIGNCTDASNVLQITSVE